MSDLRPDEVGDGTPTLQLRVFRDGRLIARELCESEEQAAARVAVWEETRGVRCEVEDLSATHHDQSAFEVSPVDAGDAYPSTLDVSEPT